MCRAVKKFGFGAALFHIILISQSVVRGQELVPDFKIAQSKDCGEVDILLNDPRTIVPWTAAIFHRSNATSDFKFLVSGVIIGPTTILSVAGGGYGSPARGTKGRYFIDSPENFMIGTGLKSTALDEKDGHAQISEVRYVLPYHGHEESVKHFHYILYHLKRPLNLRSPYARALCLPYILVDVKTNPFQWVYLQGGFSRPENEFSEDLELTTLDVTGGTQEECASIYKYYYKTEDSMPTPVFCGRMTKGTSQVNVCQMHGSAVAFTISNRWFLGGMTALIPSLRRRQCNSNTVYIYGRVVAHLDWMYRSYKCSATNEFACSNGTCLPLSSVCNSVRDCKDGSDEEPIYCTAQSQCKTETRPHECGLSGKCLATAQICDTVPDCEDGSDEAESVCRQQNNGIGIRNSILSKNSAISCLGVFLSAGVNVSCQDPITNTTISCDEVPIGSRATLRCAHQSRPVYNRASADLICQPNGEWGPKYLEFACEPECGVAADSRSGKLSGDLPLPWQAAIFHLNNGRFELSCSGTLIETSFVLSSGGCIPEPPSQSSKTAYFAEYKVVVAPISDNFLENSKSAVSQILGIKETFTSIKDENGHSLALIELSQSIPRGGFVVPACYLDRRFPSTPQLGDLGMISGFQLEKLGLGVKRIPSRRLSNTLAPVVFDSECRNSDRPDSQLPETKFCAKFQKGPGICRTGHGTGFFQGKKILNREGFTLQGVAMESLNCSSQYSEFAQLDAFEEWILSVLQKEV